MGTTKQADCANEGCGFCFVEERRSPTPYADRASKALDDIKRNGQTLAAIQDALSNHGGPGNYAATLKKIRDIIHEWEDTDG